MLYEWNLYPRLTWKAGAEGGPAGGTEWYAVWVWTCTGDLPDKLVLMVYQRVAQNHMLCECELVPYQRLTWKAGAEGGPAGGTESYAVWVWTCTQDLPDKLVLKVD